MWVWERKLSKSYKKNGCINITSLIFFIDVNESWFSWEGVD